MAFPVVQGTAETAVATAGTSHAITLPASITSTDGVLIVMDIGSTAATLNALTDWTEILDENAANGLKILWYTGAGVPGNPTFTSSAATRSASVAYRISGAVRATSPQIGTTATGTSVNPNPPSCAPTGTKDYLWVAVFGMAGEQADDDTLVTGYPANYTHSQNQKTCGVAGTNLGGMIGAATRQANGSTEDPGTFTTVDNAAWRAQTIAIHPDPTAYLTGSSDAAGTSSGTLSAPSGESASFRTVIPRTLSARRQAARARRLRKREPFVYSRGRYAGISTSAPANLTGSSTGAGTASASLTATSLLTGSSTAAGTSSGALTASPTLTGASAGAGTSAGSLTATSLLTGSSSAAGTSAGALTAASKLTGSSTGAGTSAGALTATALLVGASAGAGTSSGSLIAGSPALSGGSTGSGSSTGSLSASALIVGASAGAGTSIGTLTTGTITDTSVQASRIIIRSHARGLLRVRHARRGRTQVSTGRIVLASITSADLTGNSTAAGTSTGALTARALIVGSSAGAGTSSGTLSTGSAAPANLTGSSTGVGTSAGSLTASPQLSGTSTASGTSSGSLRAQPQLTGTSTGVGTSSGNLTVPGIAVLSGSTTSTGSSAGTLMVAVRIVGSSTGAGSTSGTLTVPSIAALSGTSNAAGTSTGALQVRVLLVGASVGSGATSGVLSRPSPLSGSSTGTGSTLGELISGLPAIVRPTEGRGGGRGYEGQGNGRSWEGAGRQGTILEIA
jgi:hypothetical protein